MTPQRSGTKEKNKKITQGLILRTPERTRKETELTQRVPDLPSRSHTGFAHTYINE